MKRCGKCGVEKPEGEFRKNRAGKDGLQAWCKACNRAYIKAARNDPTHPHHAKVVAKSKRGSAISAEKQGIPGHPYYWIHRERHWRHYGIRLPNGSFLDRNTFQAVLRFQGGRCALCGKLLFELRNAAADHDHKSGIFRGILCQGKTGCNIRILGRYEKEDGGFRFRQATLDGELTDQTVRNMCQAYLDNPPYRRWLLDEFGLG